MSLRLVKIKTHAPRYFVANNTIGSHVVANNNITIGYDRQRSKTSLSE